MNKNTHRAGQKLAHRQNLSEKARKSPLPFIFVAELTFSAFCIVTCARREVTLLQLLHMVYSAFDTLFSYLLCTLGTSGNCVCVSVQKRNRPFLATCIYLGIL